MTEDDLRHFAEAQRLLEESMQAPKISKDDMIVLGELKKYGGYLNNGQLRSSNKKLCRWSASKMDHSIEALIINGMAKKCPVSREDRYKITERGKRS